MKQRLFLATLLMTSAHATGIKQTVYDCRDGSGEFATSVAVYDISMSPPRGPIRQWTQASASSSWLGGTLKSDEVKVEVVQAADGGPTTYVNREAGFSYRSAHRPFAPNRCQC